MKKVLLLLGLVFVFVVSLAYAQNDAAGLNMKLKGVLVDNGCVNEHKADLAQFIGTHSKTCLSDPENIDEGFSLYTDDGKLIKFDEASGVLIANFLKEPGSLTRVEVEVQKQDYTGEVSLVTIKNQE